jgi:hypothetical protein
MTIDIKAFLSAGSRSTNVVEAAVADNCRFDERAGDDRWNAFKAELEKCAINAEAIDWADWGAANREHAVARVEVATGSVPDAFLDINSAAWLPRVVAGRRVVRLENLTRVLRTKRLNLSQLEDLRRRAASGRDPDARAAMEEFFEDWNGLRDARPAFCAPQDEVSDEIDDADWAHALRDRLGLGHYGLPGGAPIDVALMAYDIGDVIAGQRAARIPVACALPTTLDGGMHQFFFPVPREHPFGATVHLAPGRADTLTAEFLHCRMVYESRHLWKLGRIVRPHAFDGPALVEARDLHLISLQIECNRADFGEMMAGRP